MHRPNTLQLAVVVVLSFQWLAQGKEAGVKHPTLYRTVQLDGLSIFYREAGPKDAPVRGAAATLNMQPSTLESRIRSLKINKFQFKEV